VSWCAFVCDAVDGAAGWVEDQAEDAVGSVVDSVEDGLSAVVDYFEGVGESVEEAVSDVAQLAADVAEAAWNGITEAASSVWDWIKRVAGKVWEWTSGALEDAWNWAREAASDAWDWISGAAESVWGALCSAWDAVSGFVEEKVIPFLVDALWVLTHVDDVLIAVSLGLQCLLTGQDEREYDFIEGLYLLDEAALAQRKVTFLPVQDDYVVFSDIHMFVAGDPLDEFRQLGNSELYQAVLLFYCKGGYTLVENGDIEDLWMRETTVGEALLDQATDILGWPFGEMIEDEHEKYRIRSQAVKIFDNNSDVYQTIRALFHDQRKLVRLLGNHDDAWRSDDYLPGLQEIYPELEVFDYALLGDYGGTPPAYGNHPRVIIAHGHQLDAWNNSICRAAGAAMTECASGIPALATKVTERSEWEPTLLWKEGFPNELKQDIAGVDEVEFYETVEDDFRSYSYVPQFILGHTHRPLEDPQIPEWKDCDERKFTEYTNDGTAGRWEQFIWCATVENGSVSLYGWTWDAAGKPFARRFVGAPADCLRPV